MFHINQLLTIIVIVVIIIYREKNLTLKMVMISYVVIIKEPLSIKAT